MSLPAGLKINSESDDVDLDRPVTLIQCTPEPERMMVKIARVSNQSNDENWVTAPKLLRYCLRHGHWSVFEHAYLTVRIETELDIAAQITRHKSFAFSQFSCRYAKTSKATVPTFRVQDTKNRQNSFDSLHPEDQMSAQETAQSHIDSAFNIYERMIERGIALETARRILPVCTPTTCYMSGTLRSFIHYVQVRTDLSTQLEHRLIAEEVKRFCAGNSPLLARLWNGDRKKSKALNY